MEKRLMNYTQPSETAAWSCVGEFIPSRENDHVCGLATSDMMSTLGTLAIPYYSAGRTLAVALIFATFTDDTAFAQEQKGQQLHLRSSYTNVYPKCVSRCLCWANKHNVRLTRPKGQILLTENKFYGPKFAWNLVEDIRPKVLALTLTVCVSVRYYSGRT